MKRKQLDHIEQVRDELLLTYEQLKCGAIKNADADSLANIAGKVINSCKVQLDYHKLRKEKPDIAFLNVPVRAQG